MPHEIDLIMTLTGGFTAALILGFLALKLRLSPIVGYLLAGIVVGPFTPGFVANEGITTQCAEVGVILLMFGVGLHFHLQDLIAVWKVALPGAILQIAAATGLGAVTVHLFGWSWLGGILFGMAISVASTVVLTRVLADARALHTPAGHVAIGWLIVEDLFTILALVLLPAIFHGGKAEAGAEAWTAFGLALLKLGLLCGIALVAGQRLIPRLLGYVARTGSRDLFTLTVLVLALGLALGAAELFGASMALGAFLAGMVVGQSEFSARAATDALPMRDAFAVLFFVSVGMLLDPSAILTGWRLMLATLGVIVIGKPVVAFIIVMVFRRPVRSALSIAVALAQIGEFSFILTSLAQRLKLLSPEATGALVVASIVSITLNPILFHWVDPLSGWLERKGFGAPPLPEGAPTRGPRLRKRGNRVVLVGYGPIGQTLARILRDAHFEVVVVEMDLETVQKLLAAGEPAVYGDGTHPEILRHAGIEKADGLIVAARIPPGAVMQPARELNPKIRILTRADRLQEIPALRQAGASAVFAGEGEIALSMTAYLMRELGASDEQIDRERRRVRRELFSSTVDP